MLIGERPGEEEAYSVPPKPFIGLAGKYLDILLANAGISRANVYITNLVKTYNGKGKPTVEEIHRDSDILVEELVNCRPVVVGLLGTFAVEAVLGRERANLERTHGIPVLLDGRNGSGSGSGRHEGIDQYRRGYSIPSLRSMGVYLPIYHPASIIYDVGSMPFVQQDFNALSRIVQQYRDTGKIEVITDTWHGREKYETLPVGAPVTIIPDCAIDTEGHRRHPWCLTFSTGFGTANLAYPGTPVVVNSKVVWLHNSLHDLGVLRSLGIQMGDDQFRDTMVYAYLLGVEPQGLKELAWRHFGMQMDSYDDVIGVASENRAVEYLVGVDAYHGWKKAEPYVEIKAGIAKVRKPQGISQRVRRILGDYSKWVDNGRPEEGKIDPRKRWGNVEDHVKQEVVETLGEMPEATLDDVPRKVAERYACRDADATFRLGPLLEQKIHDMALSGVSSIDHGIIPMVDRMQTAGWKLAPVEFWDKLGADCERRMHVAVHEIQKLTGWLINPDSGDQCAELLYGHLNIKPPKMTDSGDRGSTNDKTLEAIAHLSPVVDLIFDYREPSKVKGSFVHPLRKACQQEDGRYRYGLRITRVSSGRLAGVGKPNLLAIPVRTSLGKEVRAGFVAPEGKVIYDIDLNQIEMREMADQSRDRGLIQIFVDGRLDVHTDTASKMFGKKYSEIDPEGAERYAAKRVGFGVITQITEVGLLAQMTLARAKRPDGQPWTQSDCADMIRLWFEARPQVRVFLDGCAEEVRQTGMARSRAGRIRYLPGIFSPQKHIREEAARQAGSFKISASAQEVMKVAMKAAWNRICKVGWLGVEPLIQVHDELILEVPDKAEVRHVVDEEAVWCMTKTSAYPSGIPIKAKGKFGINWKEAK